MRSSSRWCGATQGLRWASNLPSIADESSLMALPIEAAEHSGCAMLISLGAFSPLTPLCSSEKREISSRGGAHGCLTSAQEWSALRMAR